MKVNLRGGFYMVADKHCASCYRGLTNVPSAKLRYNSLRLILSL